MARLSSHSEKLAITSGLICVNSGSPILITKNLRIYGDCHEFSKIPLKFGDSVCELNNKKNNQQYDDEVHRESIDCTG
ncbi:tetratricopeptide-like helical domain, DYW domain protein [Artemisia annua]|uniref:Tetratricopeptide-like helical domain, DYW domain protein n=1 Tax=Artemisia annua TaxID=35608 RepID=A0A2U1PTI4_ARTAN|nr:tetratricopeptide-like helical domain, DYW domain protein [Artemisia annua]